MAAPVRRALLVTFSLVSVLVSGDCGTAEECEAQFRAVLSGLDDSATRMRRKDLSLDALDNLREGILSGDRAELENVHKRHLDRGSHAMVGVTVDAKHRATSSNATKNMVKTHTLMEDVRLRHHAFLPLKQPSSHTKKGPPYLMVMIAENASLYIATSEGEPVVVDFDLGHGAGRSITYLAMSPNQDQHLILTGDDLGKVRVHNIKVIAKREVLQEGQPETPAPPPPSRETQKLTGTPSEDSFDEDAEAPPQSLLGRAAMALADAEIAAQEKANASVESTEGVRVESPAQPPADRPVRVRKQLLVTPTFSCEFAPSLLPSGEARNLTAAIVVERGAQLFFVTGDTEGGLAVWLRNGTLKARALVTDDPGGVLGFMRGQSQSLVFWSSNSFGTFSVSQMDVQTPPCGGWDIPIHDLVLDPHYQSARVLLALEDGDVLIYSTTHGKSKACDLVHKFPHVSNKPYQLLAHRGHIMGLSRPLAGQPDSFRELFFFDPAQMEAGYGSAKTGTVPLQKGLVLYELYLKQPAPPKSADDGSGWLDWFPKVGVFGVALVGVVIWNVRKETSGSDFGGGGMDDAKMEELVKSAMSQAGASG